MTRVRLVDERYLLSVPLFYILTLLLSSFFYLAYLPEIKWLAINFLFISFFILYFELISRVCNVAIQSQQLEIISVFNFVIASALTLLIGMFYVFETGQPFEFNPTDGLDYYYRGLLISRDLEYKSVLDATRDNLPAFFDFSDYGFYIYNALILYVFDESILILRMMNVLWLTTSSILIYKISLLLLGNKRFALISMSLFIAVPNFYIYAAGNRKEILMICVMLAFFYQALKVAYKADFSLITTFSSIFLLVLLFLMRPLLALLLLFSLFVAFLNSPNFIGKLGVKITVWAIILAVTGVIIYVFGELLFRMYEYAQVATEANAMNKSSTSGGNIAAYPLWFYLSLFPFAPVPGIANIQGKENELLTHAAHFIKIFYIFMFILSAFVCLKHKIKQTYTLFTFVFLYFLALAINGYTVDTRFFMVLLPFIFILVPIGLNFNFRLKWVSYFLFGLMSVLFISIWNYFRIGIWE